ncbi:MAG: hypothetical protein JO188_11935 [Hyphomicrobiales bacterium]|nr:hypothetical protein [Hyphomicrobiales bacterium]
MDKKLAFLLGAVATVATAGGAQAASPAAPSAGAALEARTFGDLLNPIPNAGEVLRALESEARSAPIQEAVSSDGVQVAQYHHHHHHHHHHHGLLRRLLPHHHHYHHHHHHHHHHHWRY